MTLQTKVAVSPSPEWTQLLSVETSGESDIGDIIQNYSDTTFAIQMYIINWFFLKSNLTFQKMDSIRKARAKDQVEENVQSTYTYLLITKEITKDFLFLISCIYLSLELACTGINCQMHRFPEEFNVILWPW